MKRSSTFEFMVFEVLTKRTRKFMLSLSAARRFSCSAMNFHFKATTHSGREARGAMKNAFEN